MQLNSIVPELIRGRLLVQCCEANLQYLRSRTGGRKTRSSDKPKEKLKASYEEKIKGKIEDGLTVKDVPNKGKGVIAIKEFVKDDFICEYPGDVLSYKDALQREKEYELSLEPVGCYLYFFRHDNQTKCIDATKTNRIGRFVNHSRHSYNAVTKVVTVNSEPHLCFIASRSISIDEEILYDYADNRPDAIKAHPWLKL